MLKKLVVYSLLSIAVAGAFISGLIPSVHAHRQQPQIQHPLYLAQDVRDPIATIDPEQPIQIRVVSQTNQLFISTLLQPSEGDRPVAPGESVIFGRLHTSYLPLPIDMAAYVESPGITLSFDVSTVGNEIIVEVFTASTNNGDRSESPGNPSQSMYVDENGLIYIY